MKRLDEIFDLRYGHSLELNRLSQVEEGVRFFVCGGLVYK